MGRITVVLVVGLWAIPISILVNHIVPDPYMDEIFHVPQAQQYCKGSFRSWDPMITTPPGLYFLSLVHGAFLFPGMLCIQEDLSFFGICSTAFLRSTNDVLTIICSILIYEIITSLRPALDERKATLYAIVLSLYPLHWFFTFLYYTDVASLTAVLAMYFMSLKKKYFFSALIGAVSVFIRQTNIIWLLFVACAGIIDQTLVSEKHKEHPCDLNLSEQFNGDNSSIRGVGSSKLRKRRYTNATEGGIYSLPAIRSSSSASSSDLWTEIRDLVFVLWRMKWKLFFSFCPFFLVLLAFGAFVRWNGSIVLGAKEAHTVSPHYAQLLYFCLVSSLFMAPGIFTMKGAYALARSFWKNRELSLLQLFLALAAGFLSVHFFSIAHPYLLADNRHYPFYLWRKVIVAHWSTKYLLVPLYVYCWISIISILGKVQKKTWVLAYFLATAAVLIPAPLIEFRYYTIPFFFFVLHAPIDGYGTWILTGIIYVVIDAFTLTLFLFRPFQWAHEPGIQRFIW